MAVQFFRLYQVFQILKVQNLFFPNSTGPWPRLQKGRKIPELKHNFCALPSVFKALESNSRHFNLIGSLVSGAAWDDLLSSVFAGSPSLLSPLLSGSPFFVSIFSSLFSLFLDSFLDSDLLLESMRNEACCNYSKTCLKRPLKNRQNKDLNDKLT